MLSEINLGKLIEILKEEQLREDHVVDVLPACHCIKDIARAGIDI